MNANIKHWMLPWLAAPLFVALSSGCYNSSTNPLESQSSELEISDIRNIVWTLQEVEKAGRRANIAVYPPFHLIYNDELFFGDDGCNNFGGKYEARNDSIFPSEVAQTLRLCAISTFSVQHLTEPYRMQIAKSRVRLFAKDAVYTYRSDVTDSVKGSALARNWILIASTDPEFAEIQKQQLLPALLFDENREFKLIWYCASGNIFGCDEIFGVFGTGADGKILFYQTGSKYHAPGSGFMQKILNSSSFSIKPDTLKAYTLTLLNKSNATKFEFKSVSR